MKQVNWKRIVWITIITWVLFNQGFLETPG